MIEAHTVRLVILQEYDEDGRGQHGSDQARLDSHDGEAPNNAELVQ
jgi:hypothetical protein